MTLVHRSRGLIAGLVGSAALALSASAQYTVGSATGPYPVPSSGLGGTTPGMSWALPLLPQTVDLTRVPLTAPGVPTGALNVKSITIYNLSHTWIGDLQIVLQNPAGLKYTLIARPGSDGSPTSYGNDGDFINSDITIVDPSTPNAIDVPTTTADMLTGTYKQYFNPTWSSASQLAVISNTDMNAIPIVPGQWKLTIYDWYPADSGSFDRWEMSGDMSAAPTTFCTAGTSTNGCVPSINANNNPNVAHTGSCVITVSNVEGQKSGIVFYGINNTGYTPTPWATGSSSYLCVKGPTQRMGAVNSGGTLAQCNGALVQDFNAYLIANPSSLGQPFIAGNNVFVQGWYRDPTAVKTTNLSNALKMTFQ
jgi:hypothetical protein